MSRLHFYPLQNTVILTIKEGIFVSPSFSFTLGGRTAGDGKGHALFGLRNAKEITKSKYLADPLSIKAATQIKPQCTAAIRNRFLSTAIHLSDFTLGGCVTEDSSKV